jgi:inosose dehydratase
MELNIDQSNLLGSLYFLYAHLPVNNHKNMPSNRRDFIHLLAGASAATMLSSAAKIAPAGAYPFPISANTYNWHTFYGRQGKEFGKDWDASLADYVKTGLDAIEPSFNNAEEVKKLAPFLKKYRLALPSVYVNSVLHKSEDAQQSIATVASIAIKNDEELKIQAANLEKMGAELRKRGMTLAYHTHDMEMKAGAREFHHMLLNTTPHNVAFCFDVHWIYRGSQNSQLAVFDVFKLYGKRIVELHIRQSVNGIWSETFGEGDIDYRRLAQDLKTLKLRPHLVIEQCVEAKTANTMGAVAAHIKDLEMIKEVFKPLLG